jgi:hypothetical protein
MLVAALNARLSGTNWRKIKRSISKNSRNL